MIAGNAHRRTFFDCHTHLKPALSTRDSRPVTLTYPRVLEAQDRAAPTACGYSDQPTEPPLPV